MSILSVDNISPIGSGTSVTINSAATLVLNNVNSTGVITATSFVGGLPITNGADNRVITASSASAIQGEAGLTYDGTTLSNDAVTRNIKSGANYVLIGSSNAGGVSLGLDGDSNGDGSGTDYAFFEHDTSGDLNIVGDNPANAANIIFKTNSATERLRITSAGNIGINSTSPSTPLEIHTAASAAWKFRINTSVSDGAGFYQRANGDFEVVLRDASNNNNFISGNGGGLELATSGTEKLRILSNGHVGINRTSPTRKLHVAADNDLTSFTGTSYGIIAIENNQYDSGDYNAIDFTYSGSNNAVARIAAKITGGGSSLHFGTSNNYSSGITNEALTISSVGYVTKPAHPSFIAGRTGGNQTFTVGTFPLNVARLNVGNHYNTSTYKFVAPVAGVYYFYAQAYYNNGAGQYRMGFRKTPSGGSAFMLNTSSHKIDAGHPSGANDTADHMSIIESLAVNDTVELYSDSNYSIQCYYNINDTTYGAHTYFMGYLIG